MIYLYDIIIIIIAIVYRSIQLARVTRLGGTRNNLYSHFGSGLGLWRFIFWFLISVSFLEILELQKKKGCGSNFLSCRRFFSECRLYWQGYIWFFKCMKYNNICQEVTIKSKSYLFCSSNHRLGQTIITHKYTTLTAVKFSVFDVQLLVSWPSILCRLLCL